MWYNYIMQSPNTKRPVPDMNGALANLLGQRPTHVPYYGTPRRSHRRRGQRVARVIR